MSLMENILVNEMFLPAVNQKSINKQIEKRKERNVSGKSERF